MSIALVIEVPYDDALQPHRVGISLDLDGVELEQPRVLGELQTGHGPGTVRGAPGFVPIAIPIHNLELSTPGRYDWIVRLDDEIAERVPMQLSVVASLGPSSAR